MLQLTNVIELRARELERVVEINAVTLERRMYFDKTVEELHKRVRK
jgi:hypothetical protein